MDSSRRRWTINLLGALLVGMFALSLVAQSPPPLPTVEFQSASFTTDEGTSATITVVLSASTDADGTVDYAMPNGSAAAPGDYTSATGTVTIPAGLTSATFTVTINDDSIYESTESLNLSLSNVSSNATLGFISNA